MKEIYVLGRRSEEKKKKKRRRSPKGGAQFRVYPTTQELAKGRRKMRGKRGGATPDNIGRLRAAVREAFKHGRKARVPWPQQRKLPTPPRPFRASDYTQDRLFWPPRAPGASRSKRPRQIEHGKWHQIKLGGQKERGKGK